MPETVDEVLDALIDNADFEEVSSVSKARAYVTAARRYLILHPQTQSDQGSTITIGVAQVENLMRRAQLFVSQNSTAASGGRVRFLSASQGFRR